MGIQIQIRDKIASTQITGKSDKTDATNNVTPDTDYQTNAQSRGQIRTEHRFR